MTFGTITGGRVVLRAFTRHDITPAYVGWLNDGEVVKFSNQRFRKHTVQSCEAYLATFAGTGNLFVAICMTQTGAAVGTMTAYRDANHGTADIGIMLGDRSVWGQGIGQEAWDLMAGWLLSDGGARKITAGTIDCNAAMIRLAERSGMAEEGRRIAQELVDGQLHDVIYFGKFRP